MIAMPIQGLHIHWNAWAENNEYLVKTDQNILKLCSISFKIIPSLWLGYGIKIGF